MLFFNRIFCVDFYRITDSPFGDKCTFEESLNREMKRTICKNGILEGITYIPKSSGYYFYLKNPEYKSICNKCYQRCRIFTNFFRNSNRCLNFTNKNKQQSYGIQIPLDNSERTMFWLNNKDYTVLYYQVITTIDKINLVKNGFLFLNKKNPLDSYLVEDIPFTEWFTFNFEIRFIDNAEIDAIKKYFRSILNTKLSTIYKPMVFTQLIDQYFTITEKEADCKTKLDRFNKLVVDKLISFGTEYINITHIMLYYMVLCLTILFTPMLINVIKSVNKI